VAWGRKKRPKKRIRRIFDTHHIIPRSRGGKNEPDNLIQVERRKHEIYHELFGNKTPDQIIRYLKEYWFKNKLKLEWWK